MAKELSHSSSSVATRKNSALSSLSKLVTIIIVTSPVESNPSTELLDRCLFSIIQTWPSLSNCPMVIAADGCYEEKDDEEVDDKNEPLQTGGRRRRKRVFGKATTSQLRRYNEFLDRLESRKWMIVDRPTKIVIDDDDDCGGDSGGLLYSTEWLGFALSLQKAIQKHVATPLVFVSPHDYELITKSLKDVCVESLVSAILDTSKDNNKMNTKQHLQQNHPINYIGLHNAKTLSLHQRNAPVLQDLPIIDIGNACIHGIYNDDNNLNEKTSSPPPITATRVLLTPLASWKENPHFASVDAYRNVVFHNALNHKFKRGHFIEDTLGQKMLQTLKDNVQQTKKKQGIFASYGTFLLEVINGESKTESASPDTSTSTATSSIKVSTQNQRRQQRPCTYHINGINYIETDERLFRGYAPLKSFQLERILAAKEFVKRRDDEDIFPT